MISPEQRERALAFARAHDLDPDIYLRQCELADRLISEVIAEEQFREKSRAWFKTHGFAGLDKP